MKFLAAFIALPIIEIILFVELGGLIGVWWTLVEIFGTAMLGIWLLRNEGVQAIERIQRSFNANTDPAEPMANTAMILLAGVLLILPGFLTDAVGVIFLIPAVRRGAFNFIRKRVVVTSFSAGPDGYTRRDSDVIEGEFTEVDDQERIDRGPSGWTRH